jgi:transposase InsO family protein
VRYAFIKEHRSTWAVSAMAQVLGVSLSGLYDWLKRGKSKRAGEDEVLTEKIVMFHCGSRCTYGSPRIHKDLRAAGHQVGRKRVARLMRAAGLRGKTKRKFKTTTNSQHQRPKAENLVKQNFAVADPNTLWASDLTYISTAEGWLYLAVTLDLFSRKVVGWAFSERLTDELTLSALGMAKQQRSESESLLHHSDQGSQYASYAFRAELNANNITQSMSGKGNCYDNAVVESFFATLKTEEVEDADYQTRQQAKTGIFSYLEGFYNTKRRHSSLGYLSPNDFERVHFTKAA